MPNNTITEAALVDTIRVQLATWTGGALGVRVPDQIASLTELAVLVHRVYELAEDEWGDLDDEASIRGLAHLINAVADCISAACGHGLAPLLSALASLIVATRALV
ncbi:hypothetical protein ACIBL5_05985 [Streptomyces sp. NPDC050516]|uniref:hypothetical protein n=1 Tax=Streptomyces sp. NPDC050516 TaxID=3365621 RepID=UPI00379C90AC